MKKIEIKDSKTKPIAFKAEFSYRPAKEREYIFHHTWRQVLDKFYDPQYMVSIGPDMERHTKNFFRISTITTISQKMLSEMLGELNGSHTGARYRSASSAPATASLGAFYDNNYTGDGLKIEEIIAKGPLTKADTKIKPGCIIEKIDGTNIKSGEDTIRY